ncbi:infection structure specific protein [Apiospora arundinis]|uniref:Infection structure specific protein n=1 Tax=Apiospora arundinis TaxID=335852 RepID=A0ABR2IWA2_9PEZI
MYAPSLFTAVFFALATAQRPAAVQREAFDAKCTKALQDVLPIYALVPTPPPALESIPMPTNPCDAPTFKNDRNNTLSAQYVSYTSKVSVWYKSHSSDILAALSQCPDLVSVAAEGPFCSTTSTTSTSSSIVTPKPSPTAPTAAPKAPAAPGKSDAGSGGDSAFNAASSKPSDKPESSDAHHASAAVFSMAIAAASFLGAVVVL